MIRAAAPLRRVVRSIREPGCFAIPGGIVCGPPRRSDTLECGHVIETYGGRRENRRCRVCAGAECASASAEQGRLPL